MPLANKIRDPRIRAGEYFFIRQKDNAEVLRTSLLTEAGAMHDHDVLLANQFLDEDFVALRNVNAREGIERAARGDAAYARRRLTPLLREIAAGAQLALHFDEMILRTFERGLDGVLLRMVGAQGRAQQAMNALGVRLDSRRVAGDNAPPDAPSRDKIILRHASKGDAWHVGRDRGESDVRRGISIGIGEN